VKIFRPTTQTTGGRLKICRRIFCFPYAGAGAAIFRAWADLLPPDIELCVPGLPGRDARVDEAPVGDLPVLIPSLLEQVKLRLTLPYAIFGHSMGAFIAFDLAHEIARRGLPPPSQLFVSAQRGPSLSYEDALIFDLPDDRFLAGVIARYKNIPEALLAEREFMRVLLRVLRADFMIVEAYRYRAPAPLPCPITAFGGTEDDRITLPQLEAWAKETSSRFVLHLLPGGHFFIDSARAALLALIRQEMDAREAGGTLSD
jgi:medium-chain acyl-[acyl-carrier-protein] hydrolase